jgi:hypothetical protein
VPGSEIGGCCFGIDLGLTRKRPVEGEVDFVAVPDRRDVFVAGFRPEVVGGVLVAVERC